MRKLYSTLFISIITLSFLVSTTPVQAQIEDYTLLAPIPGLSTGSDYKTDLKTYIEGAFNLAITIGAILAFIMITYGGIIYATTDALQQKEDGRKTIENAVVGLLLVLSSWVIIYTINPNMVSFNLTLKKPETPDVGLIDAPPCVDCKTLASLGLPVKQGLPTTNKVHNSIAPRLSLLNIGMGPIDWYISEAHPPTRVHKDSCHRRGDCVDANLRVPTPTSIQRFIEVADRSGLNAVYEVESQGEMDVLVKAGVRKANILVLAPINGQRQITAPHFSVYIKK